MVAIFARESLFRESGRTVHCGIKRSSPLLDRFDWNDNRSGLSGRPARYFRRFVGGAAQVEFSIVTHGNTAYRELAFSLLMAQQLTIESDGDFQLDPF